MSAIGTLAEMGSRHGKIKDRLLSAAMSLPAHRISWRHRRATASEPRANTLNGYDLDASKLRMRRERLLLW
jgi:hypothetical protein